MNQFSMIGRLTKDPEIKELENDSKVCNVTLAVDRDYKDKEGNKITDFFNFALWDANAERICKISKKGSLISLSGHCANKEIETKDGKINTINLVVDGYRHLALAKNSDTEIGLEEELEKELEK